MIECLFYTCLILNTGLMEDLESMYQTVGHNEFVGFVDENTFYLDGIQTITGKPIWLNKELDLKKMRDKTIIHSHPKVFANLYGLICVPSEQDVKSKSFYNGRDQYLYCGDGRIIKY